MLACTVLVSAQADEIRVFGTGTIQPGLPAAAAAFGPLTGHVTTMTFITARTLRRCKCQLAETRHCGVKAVKSGFATTTNILRYQDKGLRLVGPLRGAEQNDTAY